jgi:hypothetical protein
MPRTKDEDAKLHRDKWRERKAKGLCVTCGGPRDTELLSCSSCRKGRREIESAFSRKKRAQLKSEGKCIRCTADLPDRNHVECKDCRDGRKDEHSAYQIRYAKKLIAEHRCRRCAKKLDLDYTYQNCEVCRDKQQITRQSIKHDVINYYGGICVCCHEARLEFLTIDHLEPPPVSRHLSFSERIPRIFIGPRSGMGFYRWLKKQGYPPGYRVLCIGCNFVIGHYGSCPHQNPLTAWID